MPQTDYATLVARVQAAVEREIDKLEVREGGEAPPAGESPENRARRLASLSRTLRELRTLRAGEEEQDSDNDDAVPRDIDEFRRDLARKIDGIIAQRGAAVSGEPDTGAS